MPDIKFRWTVGEPAGPQSPPWTLTVRGSDFLLAVRTPRQQWHITFHGSGERHWRFESPATLARAGGPAAGRDADAWQAPDPVDGVVTEFMLIVPTRELRPARARRRTDTVRWIDPAPPTEAIRVVLARYLPGTPMEGEAWSTPLSSGEILVVVVVAGPLNDEETALLARTKATLAAHAADAKTLKDPAGFMWGQTADRTRFWIVVGSD